MREKLIELLRQCDCEAEYCGDCDFQNNDDACYRHQAERLADHLIANGVTVQRWIPVKNRFPCIETTVLVCDAREGNIHTATFDGTLWHLDGGWLLDADDFTHWMPLPNAPKDGE